MTSFIHLIYLIHLFMHSLIRHTFSMTSMSGPVLNAGLVMVNDVSVLMNLIVYREAL